MNQLSLTTTQQVSVVTIHLLMKRSRQGRVLFSLGLTAGCGQCGWVGPPITKACGSQSCYVLESSGIFTKHTNSWAPLPEFWPNCAGVMPRLGISFLQVVGWVESHSPCSGRVFSPIKSPLSWYWLGTEFRKVKVCKVWSSGKREQEYLNFADPMGEGQCEWIVLGKMQLCCCLAQTVAY